MSATLLNKRKYRNLLSEALPVVIRTEAEYHRLLKIAGERMEKPEGEITEEEGRLLELLAVLIETYEDRVHPLPRVQPRRMLAHLLEERGMKPSDLWDVLPRSRVSEIVSGRRAISKAAAKALAVRFHVPVDLFLCVARGVMGAGHRGWPARPHKRQRDAPPQKGCCRA